MRISKSLIEGEIKNIAFVGGGGKTTIIFNLAEELAEQGKKVIITTTTHIYKPQGIEVVKEEEKLKRIFNSCNIVVVGEPCEDNKLTCVDKNLLNKLTSYADFVLVEADGAKGMPLKTPKEHEPVIPQFVEMAVAVVGMDCMGKTLREACFRWEDAETLLSQPEEGAALLLPLEEDFVGGGCIITEEILARLISSEKGLRRSVGKRRFAVILNKVDHEESERSAEKVRGLLEERGIYKCLITSYGESQRI